jgi:carbon-monoxide dehydrogenase medium subunit
VKAPDFSYLAPGSLDELVRILADEDPDTAILAGGQSLMPLLALRRVRPRRLVDINGLAGEIGGVGGDDAGLRLGALVRQRTAERDPGIAARCPLLAEAMPLCGRPAVRTRGTVGGSLAHADPAGEVPTVALALDATLTATGSAGQRTIRAGDFFADSNVNTLRPGEVLTEVELPALPEGTGTCFMEVSRRYGDRPVVGVAAAVTIERGVAADVRVALGNVAATPIRAVQAETTLRGQECAPDAIASAAAGAAGDLQPPSDLHASPAYRRHVAEVLMRRALTTAIGRAA